MFKENKNNLAINQPIQEDNQGIALILTVLILTNLLMITFVVTDVIVRIGRSSAQISNSEIAYFAAEAATEKAIYRIENENIKDASNLGVSGSPTIGNLSVADGNWERYIEPIYTTSLTCINDANKLTYHNTGTISSYLDLIAFINSDPYIAPQFAAGTISCIYSEDPTAPLGKGNSFGILLQPGKSFQLNLDINTPEQINGIDFYPNKLNISWRSYPSLNNNPAGQVIALDPNNQTVYDTSILSLVRLPSIGNFGNPPNYVIRLINDELSDYILFGMEPVSNNEYIPIGIKIISNGFYGDAKAKQRIIEADRRNWDIY